MKLRLKFREQINPDPDIYCLGTFGVHNRGNLECEHEWEKIRDEDTYAVWRCKKCSAEAGCDVWD